MLLVMHFLMPKAVLDRYWKTPYFRPPELALFTNTLYAPMRTAMLMAAIAFPRLGRKRGVTEAHVLVPFWYQAAAKMQVVLVATSFFGIILMLGIFSLRPFLSGQSHDADFEILISFLVVVACFGGV